MVRCNLNIEREKEQEREGIRVGVFWNDKSLDRCKYDLQLDVRNLQKDCYIRFPTCWALGIARGFIINLINRAIEILAFVCLNVGFSTDDLHLSSDSTNSLRLEYSFQFYPYS